MNSMRGAPGITFNRAPEMASAILATAAGVDDLSSSPAMQSAGTRRDGNDGDRP